MNNENLKQRTKRFAVDVIEFVEALPKNPVCDVLSRQLLNSGTSVGANYRAACRTKSSADFIYKMGIVEEEADESSFWMELIVESGKTPPSKAARLLKESNELLAMTVASIRTAKKSTDRIAAKRSIPQSAIRNPNSL